MDEVISFPPKFQKTDNTANIWMRSIVSLALYLVLGYYVFPSYEILLLITAIVMIHELGHFLAMKYFRYNDLGIFFIPLLGAYVSGSKREVSQMQSAIIILAGPIPGILIGIGFYLADIYNPGQTIMGIHFSRIAVLFIILNLINLFPVYPLDGGQLLNRVFLDEEGWISKIFVVLSAGLMAWFAWSLYRYTGHMLYLLLWTFPLMMLVRLQTDNKYKLVEKRIEDEGINADVSYEQLPDPDYWKIRDILVTSTNSFRDIAPGPPYEYHPREEKMMTTIQSLLHRHLIQDVSFAGKILIFLVWVAAIASPWLLKMDLAFFDKFGL
jgi:Zn-dependent protease